MSENNRLTYLGMLLYAVLCLISMATMSIGAAVVIACIVLDQGGPRRLFLELQELMKAKVVRRYLFASGLLILACVLSLVSAKWFPLNFGEQAVSVSWIKDLGKMWYFFFPILLLIGWKRLREPQQIQVIRAWFMTFGGLSIMGVVQFFTGWPKPYPNPLLVGYYHPNLFLGHHLSVASIWIFPFFAALELAFKKWDLTRLRVSKPFILSFIGFALFTLIFSFSRTLWVALPVGIAIWVFGKVSFRKALGIFVVCSIVLGIGAQSSIFQGRIHTSMGIGDRFELWKANWIFFENRPIFGVGLGKNQELAAHYFHWLHPEWTSFFVGHAHNIYLELLAGLGVFGILVWILWNAQIFLSLRSSGETRCSWSFVWGAGCAWVVLLLNGLTQVNFWEGKVMHQIMWIAGMILFWAIPVKLKAGSHQ